MNDSVYILSLQQLQQLAAHHTSETMRRAARAEIARRAAESARVVVL